MINKIVAAQNWLAVKTALLMRRLEDRKGQNTVEYLLMLSVVVGVVLLAGAAIKKFMPQLFSQIQGMISSAAGQMGSGQ